MPRVGPGAVVALSYLPLLVLHFRRLWNHEQYRFFPVLIIVVALLLWNRWWECPADESNRAAWAPRILLVAGFLLLALAVPVWSPWLAAVGANLTVAALLLDLHGWRGVKVLGPVWLLLWLLIPLPMQFDQALALRLQDVASRGASSLLDFWGYNHLLSGHVIEVPGHRFLVQEACSGIHSLFVLIAAAAVFAVWARRSLVHSILLLASAAGWAVAINVARVVQVVVFQIGAGPDVSNGWPHELLGVAMFLFGLVLLWCTDRWLTFLLEPGRRFEGRFAWEDPIEAEPRKKRIRRRASPQPGPPPVASDAGWQRGGAVGWRLAALFACAGVMQFRPFCVEVGLLSRGSKQDRVLALDVDQNTLPERHGPWRRVAFRREPREAGGKHAAVWTYQHGNAQLALSLDYPFAGWHELTHCYRGRGWTVESRRRLETAGAKDATSKGTLEVELRKPTGEYGYLLFCEFDSARRPLCPPATEDPWVSQFYSEIVRRMTRFAGRYGHQQPAYQFQAFTSGWSGIETPQRREIAGLYLRSREIVVGLVNGAR